MPRNFNLLFINNLPLLLFFLCPILVYGQTATIPVADSYSKLSLLIQPGWLQAGAAGNNDKTNYPTMNMIASSSFQAGILFRPWHYGNVFFKTGIIVKNFNPLFDLKISDQNIGYDEEVDLTAFNPYPSVIISVPLRTEYKLKLTPKWSVLFAAGISCNILVTDFKDLNTTIYVYNSDMPEGRPVFRSSVSMQNTVCFSVEGGIGISYASPYGLLSLYPSYSYNLNNRMLAGSYAILTLMMPKIKGALLE